MAVVLFWVLIGVCVSAGVIAIIKKGFNYIDFQLFVMMVAVALFYDMVLCKWLQYYSYVETTPMKAFYSLAFCVLGYPAIGIAFIKFLPSTRKGIILSILIWTTALTLIEIFYAEPYKIVIYSRWKILPESPIIYIISFVWEYAYYKILVKHLRWVK